MITEITAAVQSAKVLNDLIKAARELKNFNEFVAAVSEVNAKLMEAQSAALLVQKNQFSLTNRISDLEKEIMDLKNWEREAQRYELSEIASGVFAYKLKPGMQPPEPTHMLCANCYSKRQKSILQLELKNQFVELYVCHHCKSELKIHSGWEPGNDTDDYDPLTYGLKRRR
jgi:translation initiation factor 2B subunit (eIF-2B alpha/beta/delta family)